MPRSFASLSIFLLAAALPLPAGENLIEDPSFELPREKDQFGLVFEKWGGWKYEGDCSFAVGRKARTGKTSCLLVGGAGAKIRSTQSPEIDPGRYRITAYIRGLDIGTGTWNMTTEFMFDGKYLQLAKNGTFGWTRLTYVADVAERKKAGPSFGLMAPGRLWIDDVSLEKVGPGVALTEKPVLGEEEAPIAPPGEIGPGAVACGTCGYRNMAEWRECYACGEPLEAKKAAGTGPPVKVLASFEDRNPFAGGSIVEEHATEGKKALRLDKDYAVMDGPQDWTGYGFLVADLFHGAAGPLDLYVEIRDASTRDYWTRVNYQTVVPPGESRLIIPLAQLYVGEKSRPGRKLDLARVAKLVFGIGDAPPAPLYLDRVRLEPGDRIEEFLFEGLRAFDLGTGSSPVMEGFTQVTPATIYSKGRGYGLKDARVWRAFDALQPDPLYQDFICIESGGLAVDVPDGAYRVFVNLDSPSGFWGEYQTYRRRAVLAQGKEVAVDVLDFDTFRKRYFRSWDTEDLPADDTFDKYQKDRFREKAFDVEVKGGRLEIGFAGENWAACVSAVVIFPASKAAEGSRFLKHIEERRRFYFENYFKRVLHRPTGDPLAPSDGDRSRGYIVFHRDFMDELYYNDTPAREEVGGPLTGEAFAGEYEPVALGILPLQDLGKVRVRIDELTGPSGTIPASAVDAGFVSYRITRVTAEGSVYTIAPRYIMPSSTVDMPEGIARLFWLTVRIPAGAKPGVYRTEVGIVPEKGRASKVPLELTVRKGTLDPVDIPAGPWGYAIGVPWPGGDPAAESFNRELISKGLRRLRDYGFTTFSGIPEVAYRGFKDGKPELDFARADAQMAAAKDAGFLAVVSYGAGLSGLDGYSRDEGRMKEAGFTDYAEFLRAVYAVVQKHAADRGWIPVYWNIGDEPIGDDLLRSIENAQAYRKAFPAGPPTFTAASSFRGSDQKDPHFLLSRALHVADWNEHDEASVNLLHAAGGEWAFYNGGDRWTYGSYLYKAAKQFGLKFRISWHWNAAAGDPYYALDCREDDYAWANASPAGDLIPAVHFERVREGLDDYRRLLTLARLAKEKAGTTEARAAEDLIRDHLAAFHLGQRDPGRVFPRGHYREFRRQVGDAIESLRR
jgi:glycosyl hydrolase family 123